MKMVKQKKNIIFSLHDVKWDEERTGRSVSKQGTGPLRSKQVETMIAVWFPSFRNLTLKSILSVYRFISGVSLLNLTLFTSFWVRIRNKKWCGGWKGRVPRARNQISWESSSSTSKFPFLIFSQQSSVGTIVLWLPFISLLFTSYHIQYVSFMCLFSELISWGWGWWWWSFSLILKSVEMDENCIDQLHWFLFTQKQEEVSGKRKKNPPLHPFDSLLSQSISSTPSLSLLQFL